MGITAHFYKMGRASADNRRESNRIATPNAAKPRAGIPIPEGKRSFKPETANQKPFSWGSKGAILFCERERPL